ncbi:MAG: efflux RND transporter permease subunit [Planctomycetota bacterium]|nr:efflux RND transporter permease subunit [Planctomycetota bacterium]
MRGLADVSIARPVFGSMIIVTLVVIGGASWLRLGVDRFPSVDLPTVSVRTTLPGASTEEVETEVSQRIEEAVNQAAGLDELRSISGPGSSVVVARFDLSRDIDAAAQDVRDRVATVLRQLPLDAEAPIISKFDNDTTPVLTLALTGDLPLRELTELAELRVKPLLERSAGVGQVEVVGGLARAVNVWLDAGRMAALGVSAAEVREALVRENAEVPGGNVTTATREASLRTLGRVRDPRELEGIVVARRGEVVVRLRDVGRVEDGTKEKRSFSRLDGLPNVSLDVRRQSGANTIEVIDGVKARLEQARAGLPPGARLEVIRDQSRYIHAALHEITMHLVMGSALACLVVLLFMRSWRSTIIAGVAIPTSTVATFGVMAALGFTLNSVTMLALVLMVGIVIDDAIVVLENIFRWSEEKGVPPLEAAREGTAEIALAVLATTLSLAVIFVPVSFMSSISGRFLYQFGITSAAAVMVSLLVSFTLTPLMSSRLLRASDAAAGHVTGGTRGGLYGRLERAYLWLLERCMRRRLPVVLVALGVVAATPWLYGQVRQEYIPSDVDEAEFDINVTAPEGTSIEAMEGVLDAVEAEVRAVPHVRLVLSAAGGSFLGQVNSGRLYVRITPHEERLFSLPRLLRGLAALDPGAAWRDNATQRDVMSEVRRRLRKFGDLRCSVRNAPSFNIGGGNWDIDFAILGPDLEALGTFAEELRRRATTPPGEGGLGGIVDVDTTLKLDRPELRVQVDRERAADRGVAVRDLATALRLMVGGDPAVSRWRDASVDQEYDVQLRLEAQDREDPATIGRLLVPGARGLVRLDDLVTVEPALSPSRIDRLDRQRQVSLRASVEPGFALADRLDALRGAAVELGMPSEYSTRVQGRGRELERTFVEFLWAFLLSVILMYVVLASQFESLVHPFTILLSIPLAVPFALLALWGSGSTLNLYSALGILVLFGVVKKNAILQIDHMNVLRGHGLPRHEAVMQGNRDRLRPILMTTLTLVAGMLPLWVGAGPGAEERRAVAVVVIGGQTLALLLTLVVTPVAYTLLDDLGARLARRR